MRFIREGLHGFELHAYAAYLEEIKDSLPPGARAFALAPNHYNVSDRSSPHDSWLEQLTISEISKGERKQIRSLEIVATFLGAYHDRILELHYKDVRAYTLSYVRNREGGVVHGDWLVDEISMQGPLVTHEIKFSHDVHWVVECSDLSFEERLLPSRPDQECSESG